MNRSIFSVRRFGLTDLYAHPDYLAFGSTEDQMREDPDRAERCLRAASYGAEGSTHYEVISDWREFLDKLRLPEKVRARITEEIDQCEAWHENNGSLHDQIG
jgi:hypothetical protein